MPEGYGIAVFGVESKLLEHLYTTRNDANENISCFSSLSYTNFKHSSQDRETSKQCETGNRLVEIGRYMPICISLHGPCQAP